MLWHHYDNTQAVTCGTCTRVLELFGGLQDLIKHQNCALLGAHMLVFACAQLELSSWLSRFRTYGQLPALSLTCLHIWVHDLTGRFHLCHANGHPRGHATLIPC